MREHSRAIVRVIPAVVWAESVDQVLSWVLLNVLAATEGQD